MKKNLKHLLALCLTIALVFSLAACGQKADETQNDQQTEQEEFTPASYSIAALKGPTAMGLVKLMKDSESGETTGNGYTFTLAGSADEVTPALLKGELDMACVPANLAAVLYNKTEGEIEVLAVNTLGVLYIVAVHRRPQGPDHRGRGQGLYAGIRPALSSHGKRHRSR